MAYISTKGYYISKLKEMGITKFDGRKLEILKTHVVYNLYRKQKGEI